MLEFFGRPAEAMGGETPSAEVHDILGNDEHVVVLGAVTASSPDGSSEEWKYAQIFHIPDRRWKAGGVAWC